MAVVGPLLLLLLLVLGPIPRVLANVEVEALTTLRNKLNDPKNELQSWDETSANPCAWFHVACNNDDNVYRVDLGNASLSGQLVPQLGQLKDLQYLELYSNNISGTIPGDLGNLTQLRFLQLNNNSLTGSIPISLTSINTLEVLDLSNNNLSGEVPSTGSFSTFTPIRIIWGS